MKHLKLISAILIATGFLSSCNYLSIDKYYDDTLKYDSVFHNKINVEKYMWGIASGFPDEGAILGSPYTPGPMATDEAFCTFSSGEFKGILFTLGQVTPDDLGGLDNWGSMYKLIRKSNILLSRMNEAVDMTTSDQLKITGYTHFIRAYAYYHVLMNFGPVVILGDKVLDNNESAAYYNTYRATYDESVDYICSEFEKAAKFLPTTVLVNEFGRPTKGAAYGLIARLRLQQASPLFNGGEAARKYYSNWTRKVDGVNYVSQTYDEKKWAVAAAAAKRVMDMNLYALHTVKKDEGTPALPSNVSSASFPNGAGDIDPFRSYSDMFTGESMPTQNPEYIWARMSDAVTDKTKHSFNADIMGGWCGMSLTQKVVDSYCMADGRTISNSSADYPYTETGSTSGSKLFSGYTLNKNVSNMYVNREMRFYASVGYSGRFWPASSCSENAYKNQTITYYKGGNSGKGSSATNPNDYPPTGYVITKFIHNDDAWKGNGSTVIRKAFPIIRYAEILISYAEALNNLTKSYTIELESGESYAVSRDQNEIKNSFNQIRYRAGLPGLADTEVGDVSTLQSVIEQERMVEFLFENRRYFDVRRWGKYEETENVPIMGMNIDADVASGYYTRIPVVSASLRNRVVNRKMIFLPIPLTELRKVPNMDQNIGWSN